MFGKKRSTDRHRDDRYRTRDEADYARSEYAEYDDAEYDEHGYDEHGHDQQGYDQGYGEPGGELGYDEPGYDGSDYDTDSYRRADYADAGYAEQGRAHASYSEAPYAHDQRRDTRASGSHYQDEAYDDYAADGYAAAGYSDGYAEDANPTGGYAPSRAAGEDQAQSGPYDYEEVAELIETVADQRLDLGSVLIPVPPGGQLQVEMTPQGQPQAVHLATEQGRITVAAYAAPKSPGQWRTVAADLADSLRKDGARVAIETGPWGRELLAITDTADLRFIGVDGYRWMVRLVAAGPSGAVADDSPLVAAARAVLRETVVRRGTEPMPVRDPLPVVLPQELADQLAAAHEQQAQAQQQAQQQATAPRPAPRTVPQSAQAVLPPQMPEGPRRGADGSAMQQLGLN